MLNVLSLGFQQCFARLPCYLSNGPLKWDFLDINLTMFFGVRRFKNTSPMGLILFGKRYKIKIKFKNSKKKLRKTFFFETIASEYVAITGPY